MEVRNSNFAAFIDVFTSNTYVMVIMSDPSIRKNTTPTPTSNTYVMSSCDRSVLKGDILYHQV